MLDPVLADIYDTENTLRKLARIERRSHGNIKIAQVFESVLGMAGMHPGAVDPYTGFAGNILKRVVGQGPITDVAMGLAGNVAMKPLRPGYQPAFGNIASTINPQAYKNALNMLRAQMGQQPFA